MIMRAKLLPIFIFLLLIGCKSKNEVLLFSSNRNGNSDIFLMNPSNSTVIQLTSDSIEEWSPTWINSDKISFLRQRGNTISRHQLEISTKKEIQLDHPSNCLLDDKNILYHPHNGKQLYQCKGDIFVYDPKNDSTVFLTKNLAGVSQYPSWSHNGKLVTFTNNQSGNNDIYIINLGTNELEQLTTSPSNDERSELSPNGEYLVFSSDKFESKNQDILVMNLATKEVENITQSKGTELIAKWSGDGRSIYFGSNKDDNWELYLYDINKEKTTRLTDNESFDGDPRVLK